LRIKNISIKNFLSFEEANITLTNSSDDLPSIYIINGLNYDNTENDDASNGSGKSVIVGETIFYSLFGKSLRGSKQKVKLNDMIRFGTEAMFNKVEFLVNNENEDSVLTIKRHKTLDGASTTSINIDGEEKTKRTKRLSDKDIKLFVDISPETFAQVVVYYKDNTNLLSMNYGQRLDFFKNIIKLDIIDDYYLRFKNFKNINDKILDRLRLNYKNTEEIVNIVGENKDSYISYIKNKINELNGELSEAVNSVVENSSVYEEEKNEVSKEIDIIVKNLLSKKSLLNNLNDNIVKIDKEVKRFSSLAGVACPTCMQIVTNEYADSIVQNYIDEKNNLTSELLIVSENIDCLEKEKKKNSNRLNELNEKLNDIRTTRALKEQTVKKLQLEIEKYNLELINYENKVVETVDKSKYEKRLEAIKKAIHIREDWEAASNYWCDLFAPKSSLRSSIIRKYISILSDMFEYYISKLYSNEILGKITIDDDSQIDIYLYKENFETNYWQMSSGERKRIDVAMLLSLYEFTSYLNPNMPKFLILDEIFDSLDQQGVTAVMETLLDIQSRHNIDLFIISHISIPLEMIPEDVPLKNIFVVKKNGISSVKHVS